MKFKSKSRVVEAHQWFPGVDLPGVVISGHDNMGAALYSFGGVRINAGEWIVDGHAAPCPDASFTASHDPVVDKVKS